MNARKLVFAVVAALGIAMAQVEPAHAQDEPNPYTRTNIMTGVTLGMGLLHHTDHVLRANHSGWPFTRRVTPFTYSLAIYPIIGTGVALDAGPLTWIVLDSVASVGLGLAHTLIEPPHHQHDPWRDGTNVFGVESAALGRTSQALSIGLSLSLLAHLGSSIADGVHCGFTWKRGECQSDPDGSRVQITSPRRGVGAAVHVEF